VVRAAGSIGLELEKTYDSHTLCIQKSSPSGPFGSDHIITGETQEKKATANPAESSLYTTVANEEWSPLERQDTHGIHTSTMAGGGNSPMTAGDTATMPTPKLEQFPLHMPPSSCPALPSHQSSSLPSTPYIAAREPPNECRTPSPIVKGSDITSPRSARSESDTGTRPSGRTAFLAGCKFETGMAFSRRRIPYSLGGDRLERVTSGVKKQLDPNEEEKLSGDMRELYDRILPSAESEDRRMRFVEKLERILNGQWPGNSIKVHVFGSSGNLLCTTDSDGQ